MAAQGEERREGTQAESKLSGASAASSDDAEDAEEDKYYDESDGEGDDGEFEGGSAVSLASVEGGGGGRGHEGARESRGWEEEVASWGRPLGWVASSPPSRTSARSSYTQNLSPPRPALLQLVTAQGRSLVEQLHRHRPGMRP